MSAINSDSVRAGASGVSAAHIIENSCRFNQGDSPQLSRTPGTRDNADICTISLWVKRSTLSAYVILFSGYNGSGYNSQMGVTNLAGGAGDNIHWWEQHAAGDWNLTTTRVARDPGAWMHLVFVYNSPDGTAADRQQLWVNGVRETAFSVGTYSAEDADSFWQTTTLQTIGYKHTQTQNFGGYLCHQNKSHRNFSYSM